MRRALLSARLIAGACVVALVLAGTLEGASALAYLDGLHGSLGAGLPAALLAAWSVISIVALPPALWALWPALRSVRARLQRGLPLAGILLAAIVVLALSAWKSHRDAQLTASAAILGDPELEAALAELGAVGRKLPKSRRPVPALLTRQAITCGRAPSQADVTLLATFVDRDGKVASECLQEVDVPTSLARLKGTLRSRASRAPLQVDFVSGWQRLRARHGWLDALKLRPGLDGVCDGARCLLPGQLLAFGFFSTHRPVALIPDFQFGVEARELRHALGGSEGGALADLERVTTRSYTLDLRVKKPAPTALLRLRRRDVSLDRAELARAERAAESHVLGAQLPSGKFRYTLEPFSGQADAESLSLARQGGTLLALCELGQDSEPVRQAIERSLSAFGEFERRAGDQSALTTDPRAPTARLGETTLPLVSSIACSARLGRPLDELVARLSRFVLGLQREDGGFWPALSLAAGAVERGPEPLYAAGQAVLALVLLEEQLRKQSSPQLPDLEQVRAALELAMTHVAERYWSHPLRDFFFVEENWHCLAARAALSVHRHAGYEDFCLDYVRFKARLILRAEDGVDPDFDGGFGFGNIVPPHNTGAAGFGEALAAALAIRHARGEDAREDEALLRRVLAFLLRQQWTKKNCHVCVTPLVIGAMSEHTHSAITRIDFAQHAWAALGHGGRVLGITREPAPEKVGAR